MVAGSHLCMDPKPSRAKSVLVLRKWDWLWAPAVHTPSPSFSECGIDLDPARPYSLLMSTCQS